MPTQKIREFWERTRAELDEVEIDPAIRLVEDADEFTTESRLNSRNVYRVTMSSFQGTKIRAWLTVPTGHPPPGGWPAIMEVPGYSGILTLPSYLTQFGYATLSLFPRGQGESEKEWKIEEGTWVVHNITGRDRYYYRGAYMDCVRGVDFLDSRPEIDSSRLGVWGLSQGGGLSLATSALDHRISAAVAAVPWLCNFPEAVGITTWPYVEIHDWLKEHPGERDAAMSTLTYFDQLNLSDAIACPILVASAIKDEVHPLSTVMPVFDNIQSMKSIIVYPDLEHDWRSDFTHHGKAWMDRYLR